MANQQQTVTCPGCKDHVDPNRAYAASGDALLVQEGIPPRRITRYVDCACGVVLALAAWEGWDRWYLKGYSEDKETWQRGPEADAYYARENAQKNGLR